MNERDSHLPTTGSLRIDAAQSKGVVHGMHMKERAAYFINYLHKVHSLEEFPKDEILTAAGSSQSLDSGEAFRTCQTGTDDAYDDLAKPSQDSRREQTAPSTSV